MPLLGKKKSSSEESSSKSKRWSFGRKKKTLKGDDSSAPPSPLTPSAFSSTFPTAPSPAPSSPTVNQFQNPNPYALGEPPTPTTSTPPPALTQQASPPPSAGLFPPSAYPSHSRKSSTASGRISPLPDVDEETKVEGGYINGGYVNPYANPYLPKSTPEPTSSSPAPDGVGVNGAPYRNSTPIEPISTNPYQNPYSTNIGLATSESLSSTQDGYRQQQQQQLLMREEEEYKPSRNSFSGYSARRVSMSYEARRSMSYDRPQQDQLLIREEETANSERRGSNPYNGYNANRLSARYGSGKYNSGAYNPYNDYAYAQAQEDEEEEDVEAIKQEIRFVKQETVSNTRNAIRAGLQAEELGRDTLFRLGTQGEHLHNAEKSLDISHSKNRIAADSARELKTLNRSMFAVHVKNPFNSKERQAERERTILERHDADAAAREETRKFGYGSQQTAKLAMKNNPMAASASARNRMSLVERSKYQFEADASDDEKEDEIDDNLNEIGQIAGRLKDLAVTTGKELDRQNKQIGKIAQKNDQVAREVAVNTGRLDRLGR